MGASAALLPVRPHRLLRQLTVAARLGTRPLDEPPVIQSLEPGEDWFWNYEDEQYAEGLTLAPPQSHPVDQPVPGPAGRVPADWQEHIHA